MVKASTFILMVTNMMEISEKIGSTALGDCYIKIKVNSTVNGKMVVVMVKEYLPTSTRTFIVDGGLLD